MEELIASLGLSEAGLQILGSLALMVYTAINGNERLQSRSDKKVLQALCAIKEAVGAVYYSYVRDTKEANSGKLNKEQREIAMSRAKTLAYKLASAKKAEINKYIGHGSIEVHIEEAISKMKQAAQGGRNSQTTLNITVDHPKPPMSHVETVMAKLPEGVETDSLAKSIANRIKEDSLRHHSV